MNLIITVAMLYVCASFHRTFLKLLESICSAPNELIIKPVKYFFDVCTAILKKISQRVKDYKDGQETAKAQDGQEKNSLINELTEKAQILFIIVKNFFTLIFWDHQIQEINKDIDKTLEIDSTSLYEALAKIVKKLNGSSNALLKFISSTCNFECGYGTATDDGQVPEDATLTQGPSIADAQVTDSPKSQKAVHPTNQKACFRYNTSSTLANLLMQGLFVVIKLVDIGYSCFDSLKEDFEEASERWTPIAAPFIKPSASTGSKVNSTQVSPTTSNFQSVEGITHSIRPRPGSGLN